MDLSFPDAEIKYPSSTFVYDMRNKGLELFRDSPDSASELSVDKFELVNFLGWYERSIGGWELVCRAHGRLNAKSGQREAEWLMRNQELIPKEWGWYRDKWSNLLFTGTLWTDPHGHCYIPVLSCFHWKWSFNIVLRAEDFDSAYRLVRNVE